MRTKAFLDHVGIAVRDVSAALAFFEDALGLEVEATEEVASQRVRAHFVPLGQSSLELLEATAADSPIAKYLEKRGPGLHHITLRVDDIAQVLSQLKSRGTRLIDEQPRPGAEGALVAFIHPSSAHGVLVELKQASAHTGRPPDPQQHISRYQVGDLELISLYDGYFRLDGGSMFGIVPRSVWAKQMAPDDSNLVALAMRPLVVRGTRTMLVDAGLGDKNDARFHELYGVNRAQTLDQALSEAGLFAADIDVVLATHLHFDDAGGFTVRGGDGRVRPRFPRARYIVRRGEWEDATHPSDRTAASYRADDYLPLAEAGVLELVDEDQTIMPGVKVQRTGGHTPHHQMVWIESHGRRAAYVADLMPTTAHVREGWIASVDLQPADTLAAKKAFLREIASRETLVLFDHDPIVAAGYVEMAGGKPTVRPA